MPPKGYRFNEGEKVLCYHGPLLYEAKVIKMQVKEKQVKYYVHYQGWNKSWDEWVPENRVLKHNEANLTKQTELQQSQQKSKKNSAKKKGTDVKDAKETVTPASSTVSSNEKSKPKVGTVTASNASQAVANQSDVKETGPGPKQDHQESQRKKRSRVEPHVEPEDAFVNKMEIKIKIPEELKPWLVDDWDLITRQRKLVHLPARITVDQILSDYVMSKQKTTTKSTPSKESIIIEVTNGIKEYFNSVLGTQLLYKFERPQYQNILSELNDEKPLSSIYGAFHLLRLFVKLGNMLIYTNLEEKSLQLLLVHIHDFLKYFGRNSSLFSLNDYVVASPEYHRRAL